MNSRFSPKRLVSRTALIIEATALCMVSMSSMAAVIDGPTTNLAVPATFDGIYLNFVTGASGLTGGATPGWDIDPYQAGAALQFFWNSTPATSHGGVATTTTGPMLDLAIGTTVSAASTFTAATAATATSPYLTAGDRYLGFRFFNEATSAINYGYARISTGATSGFPATIVCYRYENTGAAITVAACGAGANTAPTLTYNPTTAAGVTFPAGAAGSVNSTIAITSAGAAGTGQSAVTGCAITGAGAASFGAVTTTPANGIFNTATTSGSINLSCTRGASAATATLACTETATPTVSGSPFTRTWALTCPAAIVTDTAPVAAVAPATLTGGTGSVTPTITTPAQGTGSTVFACSIPATAPSNFAITSNATQTLNTATAPAAIGLSCVPQPAVTTATLTCTQTATPAPNPANATATITCPAAVPVITPGTASGTTLTLPGYAQPVNTSVASLTFTATGASVALTCSATGTGFSVTPSPLNLAVGVPGTVNVRYNGSTPGTFTGTLTCTSKTAGGPFTYPLSIVVRAGAPAIPLPAMNSAGTWMLLLSVLGLGLWVSTRTRD